jgi:hypothetical protein
VIIQSVWQKSFDFSRKPVVVAPSKAQLSSDAGLLPIRQFDAAIGMTDQFAAALTDPRHQGSLQHSLREMVRSRVFGILADYADQNDHGVLRSDPVFKLIAGRSVDGDDLASQPTLSRFENAIDVPSLRRLQNVFIDQFIASFDAPPTQLTFDIDPFDDPTHGDQQLTFFHGYYGQYQYLPRAITCAENDLVVMICLLFGTAHAALGADDDLQYLVARLRAVWPDVRIMLRADSGFGVPTMYDICERLEIDYTIGVSMNATLKKYSDPLLEHCIEEFDDKEETQRKFCASWYKAGSWPAQRWVVIKCEVNSQGTNRRAVVTNRPGATVLPGAAYDAYADRGESENRNKELKCGLQADRLSDHRYMANLFRLYLHALGYNLLARLRHVVADPLPEPNDAEVPSEVLAGDQRRQHHNRRRQRDPLGRGQPNTWRMRLIKVAAHITETSRRVVVELPGSWPFLDHYRRVSDCVLAFSAASLDSG